MRIEEKPTPETDLVKVENIVAKDFFIQGKPEELLNKIKGRIASFNPDSTTAKGRKAITALSMEPVRIKTFLGKIGKAHADELKQESKAFDEQRRYVSNQLDLFRDTARQPLIEWEEKEKARLENEKLKKEIETAFDEAISFNRLFNMRKDLERREEIQRGKEQAQRELDHKEKVRQEQKKRDEQIAKEAAEEAKAREEQAIKDKEKAEARQIKQEEDSKNAAKLAEKRRKQDVREAKEKAERKAAKEAQDKEVARAKEEKRVSDEKKVREEDLEHRKEINNDILMSLMHYGFPEDDSKRFITSLAKGQVQHLKIIY